MGRIEDERLAAIEEVLDSVDGSREADHLIDWIDDMRWLLALAKRQRVRRE